MLHFKELLCVYSSQLKHCNALSPKELLHVNAPGPHRPGEQGEDNRLVCIDTKKVGGEVTTEVMPKKRGRK